jgi:uncharacterized protein YjbI with pentapeptide repeats
MGLFDWFSSPKPLPRFEIKDLNGNVIFVAPWSDLWGRDLSGLVLHNANMIGVRMTGCDLRGTDWTGSKFNNASITACDMRNSVAQYCDFSSAVLSQCQIDGADFLCTEFGRPNHRCKMQDVKGQAVMSSEELINGAFNDKHVMKFKKTTLLTSPTKPSRPRQLRGMRRSRLDLYPEAVN